MGPSHDAPASPRADLGRGARSARGGVETLLGKGKGAAQRQDRPRAPTRTTGGPLFRASRARSGPHACSPGPPPHPPGHITCAKRCADDKSTRQPPNKRSSSGVHAIKRETGLLRTASHSTSSAPRALAALLAYVGAGAQAACLKSSSGLDWPGLGTLTDAVGSWSWRKK